MAEPKVYLAGQWLEVEPSEIRWNFKLKVNDIKTLGGKVVQVNGVHMSDITLSGKYHPIRAKGDQEAWEQQVRFREWVNSITEGTEAAKKGRAVPVRFIYRPRGWDFAVFIKEFSGLVIDESVIAQDYTLTLFPADSSSREVVKGIRDLYLKRLLDGVGWKQTAYNGPTQDQVDAVLAPFGGSAQAYIEDRASKIASGQEEP